MEKKHMPVSLYLHFPFCIRKCRYCDFLSWPASDEDRERYVTVLCREIRGRAAEAGRPEINSNRSKPEADTVFIGGGTPSLLTPAQLERIMEAVNDGFELLPGAEISMEVNPGTADLVKLRAYRELGINRLSVGVQSFSDAELRMLGRIHTARQAVEIIEEARRAGFDNLNIDLMSALPGQTLQAFKRNLARAVEMEPEHISAYSLILEEGTPLRRAFESGTLQRLPDEEEDRAMYHFTREFLSGHGYERYEISNYARRGYECRHNCGYWTGHEYLGLGPGAASLLGGERFHEPEKMGEYLRRAESAWKSGKTNAEIHAERRSEDTDEESGCGSPDSSGRRGDISAAWEGLREDREQLSVRDRMEEFMFLGLRMTAGISEADFTSRFGTGIDDVYGDVLRRHQEQRVICRRGGRVFLTEYGLDVANYVMADYLFE